MPKFKTIDAKPLAIDRYIKLTVETPLDKEDVAVWFRCVRRHAPSGVLKTITLVDNKHRPRVVSLVHRVEEQHGYLIPLTRDLTDSEVESVVQAFAEHCPKLDFDVETNATSLRIKDAGGISVEHGKHLALCTALAKQRHEDWMRERSDAGWRYGTAFNAAEKTHPLLRPWDQLPDRYRRPDLDWPDKLVRMLNDQGYAIIPKDELERLLTILRGVVA